MQPVPPPLPFLLNVTTDLPFNVLVSHGWSIVVFWVNHRFVPDVPASIRCRPVTFEGRRRTRPHPQRRLRSTWTAFGGGGRQASRPAAGDAYTRIRGGAA